MKKQIKPEITEKQELLLARIAAGVAVLVAGYFGINPPGYVAQVVALAFGLAAASFFPAIVMGIFSTRINKEGAIAGIVSGLLFTICYIVYFKFISPELNTAENWWFSVSPEGTLGMLINFLVTATVSYLTPAPPQNIIDLVREIRVPKAKQ